jgi:hypothetical protein
MFPKEKIEATAENIYLIAPEPKSEYSILDYRIL